MEEGLVCVLGWAEPCQSSGVRRNREKRQRWLGTRERKCLHLCFYLLERDFGWMRIRLQTGLALTLQVCVKGREWLARQMKRQGRVGTES